MKKTILLIIALITGIYSANAQYKKGDIELGGEISYKVTDGFHQFAVSPEAEFFLNEHWAINTGISLFGNNHKTRFGISAGVNYYLPITQKLYFAPRGGFDVEFTESNWAICIKPNLVYELTEHIAMSLGIGYIGVGQFDDNNNTSFRIGICDNLAWGIAYKF